MRIKSHEDVVLQGQAMGEDFAKVRGREMVKMFLVSSRIFGDAYEDYKTRKEKTAEEIPPDRYLELLCDDYLEAFGQIAALCYAMGYIDSVEKTRSDLYKKGKQALEVQDGEKPSQLILPGMDV